MAETQGLADEIQEAPSFLQGQYAINVKSFCQEQYC